MKVRSSRLPLTLSPIRTHRNAVCRYTRASYWSLPSTGVGDLHTSTRVRIVE